jgi:hypothetical protein
LTVIYSLFHLTASQYILFSVAHGIFSKIDHILGHKASFFTNTKKLKEKTLYFIRPDGIKLEINSKRSYRKYSNTWRQTAYC